MASISANRCLHGKKYANGETPGSSGIKGDHLVGKYYVRFEQEYKSQTEELVRSGMNEPEARNSAPLMVEAREMLLKWEQGDPEVVDLWKTMNSWVYTGFDETYKMLGVDFDKIYYESETYITGKEIVHGGAQEEYPLSAPKITQYGSIFLPRVSIISSCCDPTEQQSI